MWSPASALEVATFINPPTATVAPPTIAVPHFATVPIPEVRVCSKLDAFSVVLSICEFASSEPSIAMVPINLNKSM